MPRPFSALLFDGFAKPDWTSRSAISFASSLSSRFSWYCKTSRSSGELATSSIVSWNLASCVAVVLPTSGMARAKSQRESGRVRALSIAWMAFVAFFSPNTRDSSSVPRFSLASCSVFNSKRSSGSRTSPRSTSLSATMPPTLSMSSAVRAAKNSTRRVVCAGH